MCHFIWFARIPVVCRLRTVCSALAELSRRSVAGLAGNNSLDDTITKLRRDSACLCSSGQMLVNQACDSRMALSILSFATVSSILELIRQFRYWYGFVSLPIYVWLWGCNHLRFLFKYSGYVSFLFKVHCHKLFLLPFDCISCCSVLESLWEYITAHLPMLSGGCLTRDDLRNLCLGTLSWFWLAQSQTHQYLSSLVHGRMTCLIGMWRLWHSNLAVNLWLSWFCWMFRSIPPYSNLVNVHFKDILYLYMQDSCIVRIET